MPLFILPNLLPVPHVEPSSSLMRAINWRERCWRKKPRAGEKQCRVRNNDVGALTKSHLSHFFSEEGREINSIQIRGSLKKVYRKKTTKKKSKNEQKQITTRKSGQKDTGVRGRPPTIPAKSPGGPAPPGDTQRKLQLGGCPDGTGGPLVAAANWNWSFSSGRHHQNQQHRRRKRPRWARATSASLR